MQAPGCADPTQGTIKVGVFEEPPCRKPARRVKRLLPTEKTAIAESNAENINAAIPDEVANLVYPPRGRDTKRETASFVARFGYERTHSVNGLRGDVRVGVKKPENITSSYGCARIHLASSTAVSGDNTVGLAGSQFHGAVSTSPVDHDDFCIRNGAAHGRQKTMDHLLLVQNRNNNRQPHGMHFTAPAVRGQSQTSVMKNLTICVALGVLLLFGQTMSAAVEVPAGVNNSSYDRLLKKYVNDRGLVAYGRWRESAEDMKALNDYLAQFGKKGNAAAGSERYASLINAYNAFVLQWILQNYPTESIWALKSSFKARRHQMGGAQVALNDIENEALRPEFGYRTHAVLVCAARSCPPLQQSPYEAGTLDEQVDHAYRTWLGRTDLNEFSSDRNEAAISSIFKWFKGDFDKAGGVKTILKKYAPANAGPVLQKADSKISYKPYNWGLNDQGPHGRNWKQSVFDFL